jgi:acyl-CoA reductase-like NAD-dependent aldehyde dehydrogenase
MTSSENIKRAAEPMQPEQATARILELLDKLAAAEGIGSAAEATGVSEDQVRASLRQAADIIRQNREPLIKRRWPRQGTLLDWRDMTVEEALDILADVAINPNTTDAHTPRA